MSRSLCCGFFLIVACSATKPNSGPLTAVEIPRAEPTVAESKPAQRVAPPVESAIAYRGELWSGGDLISVETSLSTSDGALSGHYVMLDGERRMPGELSQCFANDGSRFTCMWQDEFGVGGLELGFSADRERFEGQWWSEATPNDRHPWNGLRAPTIAQ